jgi:hypothetical protein
MWQKQKKLQMQNIGEKEEGNNKAIISYTYDTLHSNEVLYKTLTWPQ